MTKEEIQASIKSIMFSGSVCGIEIYLSVEVVEGLLNEENTGL